MRTYTPAADLVEITEIRAAAARLTGLIARTPLVESEALSTRWSCRVLLKAENLQQTGSFKVRGALNALLARAERGGTHREVVTFSAGNHGAAVAWAARRLGLRVAVCMPPGAVAAKVAAVRRYGGHVEFTDDLVGTATSLSIATGAELLHPFEDRDVIAGHATVGLELVEDVPDSDLVVVPVGGGGLISGIGAALGALSPATHVAGAEPSTAAALAHAVRAGGPEPLPTPARSLADGLTAPFAGPLTYAHARAHVHHLVSVSEQEIEHAWSELVAGSRLLVEPSAAVTLAALERGGLPVPTRGTVVLVATGGNADFRRLDLSRR